MAQGLPDPSKWLVDVNGWQPRDELQSFTALPANLFVSEVHPSLAPSPQSRHPSIITRANHRPISLLDTDQVSWCHMAAPPQNDSHCRCVCHRYVCRCVCRLRARYLAVVVGKGVLRLTARRAPPPDSGRGSSNVGSPRPAEDAKPYTSARLSTMGLAAWRTGRVEVCARLPLARGARTTITMKPAAARFGTKGFASGELNVIDQASHS